MVRQVNAEWAEEPLKKIFTKKSPKPILSSKDRKFLEEYYREDVKNLQQFLQKTLPWKIAQDKGGGVIIISFKIFICKWISKIIT